MPKFRSALALTVLLAGCLAARALAQCEIPLIIGSGGSTANVLIIMDSSGSMNEIVYHTAYVPTTSWSGNFTRTSTYNIPTDGNYTPRSFNSKWPNTPSAYLVNSDAGENGQYSGNYLNWVFFNATATQRAAIPTYTKIQGAKSVVNNVLTTVTSCRFAVEIYNGDNGGTILCPFGTSVASMQTAVNGVHADDWTPLAESMETALNYYRQTGASAPIQASCQKSFVVLVTDGLPTQDVNVSSYLRSNDCGANDGTGSCTGLGTPYPNSYDCSAYLDNVTCYMYRQDLRSDLSGIQNVATFVIGFNVTGALLQTAANVGGGEFYTAADATELNGAIQQSLNVIAQRVAAGASVSVVAAEDRINNRLFRARYQSGSWKGYVEAFNLPFQAGQPPLWEAGALLAARTPSTRSILTSTTGTNTYDFTVANAATLQTPLGAIDLTNAQNIITYIRGSAVVGTRDRAGWVLGDIVDASPVAVGKPTMFSTLTGYAAFRSANANRGEVLYVGGNDGMMHCFDTTNGAELWGYIPKTQLPQIKDLMSTSYCHEYFVNTTPAVVDMTINGTWKTMLFGGEEGGTNGMYALDVTDPTNGNMSVLWDTDIPRLRGSWNTPTVVRDPTRTAYTLVVGTGYSASALADSLIRIDPENGSVLSRVPLGSAVAGNKTTRATAFDRNFDYWDDLLYVGDLAGRLWRVNLATDPWTVTCLFSCGQPIQAAPVVTMNSSLQPMIFFGTGQYLLGADPSTTTQQTIYCVIDNGAGTTFTPTDLVNQTSTINSMTSSSHGWYVNLLNGTGERVTRNAALINGTLYIPSFRPSTDACSGGGQSWLYSLDYKDGSAPDNNGVANNTTSGRTDSMGDGMLADPTVDLVNEAVLLQSSNAVVISQSINGGLQKLMVRGWHQKWN